MLLGHRTVCAVEYDAYARSVLLARQNDGTFPAFPVWDDVRTFDGKPWRGIVDCVSGGFPCQDISCAGNGAGLDGERSGLWSEMARIIREVRPRYAFIENSPMLVTRGLDRVLADLAAMGFDARWGIVSAADTGAFHKRERIWILADAKKLHSNGSNDNARISVERGEESELGNDCWTEDVADSASIRQQRQRKPIVTISNQTKRDQQTNRTFSKRQCGEWPTEPELGRVADGVADRSNRLKAIGNGQVPRVRAAAWRILGGE